MLTCLSTFSSMRRQLRQGLGVAYQCFSSERALALNDLQFIKGSRKERKRVGRGPGTGDGKTCGFGHQKSRSTPRGFEGGQTPLWKRFPKFGFTNPNHRESAIVNLNKLQEFIDMGRIKPKENGLVTMRDLLLSGIISDLKDGVKLLADGKEIFKTPIHLEVSFASSEAIKAIESAGGTVTCVHFNALALRALIRPYKFDILPRRARPNPSIIDYYLDKTKSGYLSPEIQIRNLKLFGVITSEEMYRKEHDDFMDFGRFQLREMRNAQDAAVAKGKFASGEAKAQQ